MTTNRIVPHTPDSSQPTPTNWRDLDLSTPEGRNALNREIARRRNQDPAETYDWAYNYANSVDAALTLEADIGLHFTLRHDGIDFGGVESWAATFGREFASDLPTPALAICCAWLAMKDAKGAQS